jgi:hypothetical protein
MESLWKISRIYPNIGIVSSNIEVTPKGDFGSYIGVVTFLFSSEQSQIKCVNAAVHQMVEKNQCSSRGFLKCLTTGK